MRSGFYKLAVAALVFMVAASGSGQERRRVITSKGESHDALRAHELEWWTNDPLRLDENDDMRFFQLATDGHAYTPLDYKVEQKMTQLGVVAGHRIVEVLDTIYFEQRLVLLGVGSNDKPAQWKSLLVETATKGKYVEIFRLQSDPTVPLPLSHAAIYRAGRSPILGTYDPSGGNGGGCTDGYWWFDRAGAHAVSFSALEAAMHAAAPRESHFETGCWAMHPEIAEVRTWVQRDDAECHACGGLGKLRARYRIVRGKALPMKVSFTASPN